MNNVVSRIFRETENSLAGFGLERLKLCQKRHAENLRFSRTGNTTINDTSGGQRVQNIQLPQTKKAPLAFIVVLNPFLARER